MEIISHAIGVLVGIALGTIISAFLLALVSPLLPGLFKHDPNNYNPIQFYIQVDKNRAVVIERAGNPLRIIQGGQGLEEIEVKQKIRSPVFEDLLFNQFEKLEQWIYEIRGFYVYVPFFTKPKVIPLPRYEIEQDDHGKNQYIAIKKNNDRYLTNHVRTALTTWYFEYQGIDIQGIPFTVFGSIQYSIDPEKVEDALYRTDAWNVLLDQASYSVIRSNVRFSATLKEVIGGVMQELWEEPEVSDNGELLGSLGKTCREALKNYEFQNDDNKSEKLSDYGILIHGILFNDFRPELDGKELQNLRAPALQQQVARGEYHHGTAVAENQQKLLDVYQELGVGKEAALAIIEGEAHVRAVQDGGGVVESLISTFNQKQRREDKK